MSQSRFARNNQLAPTSFDEFFNSKIEEVVSKLMGTGFSAERNNTSQPPKVAAATARNARGTIPRNTNGTEPKWIPSKYKCQQCYNGCSGQLNKFLFKYLPFATDFVEQLSAKIDDSKVKEMKAIFDYLSSTSIPDNLFKEELDKQMKYCRNKMTKDIYSALKINKGCILTKLGTLYPCRYDGNSKWYIPILKEGKYTNYQRIEWGIPDVVKNDEYVIVAHFDNIQRKRIMEKLDLKTFKKSLLFKSYASNKRI